MDFCGTARFDVLRRLGAGGMGIVYEAFDRERGVRIALKTLRDRDPAQVLRLKHEFRSLRDLTHANLVALGELIEEQGQWFFTMELVTGTDFLRHVRPLETSSVSAPGPDMETNVTPAPVRLDRRAISASSDHDTGEYIPGGSSPAPTGRMPAGSAVDVERLRPALIQLTEGLMLLHRHGKVHRDIKPPNLMVEPDGRVVILDFGLVTEHKRFGDGEEAPSFVLGTPSYMAPEQMTPLGEIGPAADWYSVGVLLYECLLGRPPLRGSFDHLCEIKQRFVPEPPHLLDPALPLDLSELAGRLLIPDVRRRATGEDILRALDRRRIRAPAPERGTPRSTPFLGRERERQQLRAFLTDAEAGKPAVVIVEGPSGVGKSALVRRFAEETLHGRPAPLLFSGRCHERESVPFKAFDGIVDEIAGYLSSLPDTAVTKHLPADTGYLARAFPVLQRVRAIAAMHASSAELGDLQELRRRVFEAFKLLIRRLADDLTLLFVIDDLQWADEDSYALLGELLRGEDAPVRLLVIASVRAQPGARWLPPHVQMTGTRVHHLPVPPLPEDTARDLVRFLLDSASANELLLGRISEEAAGHPLFIQELVRHVQRDGEATGTLPSLDEAIWQRTLRLDDTCSELLRLVVIAGGPLPNQAFANAAGLNAESYGRALGILRQEQLVRSHGLRHGDVLEPNHDRIRETIASRISPLIKQRSHARIARALEPLAGIDAEIIATHFAEADERPDAFRFMLRAAHQAEEALAFDRAARLYERCVAIGTGPGLGDEQQRRTLLTARAHALANAGRSVEAADLFLALSTDATGAEAVSLLRLSAERYLQSGHLDRGMPVMEKALALTGMRSHQSSWRTLLTFVGTRARLALRGSTFTERTAGEVPATQLQQVEMAISACAALSYIDALAGATFGTQALWFALQAGEPNRVCRALLLEYASEAVMGGRDTPRLRTLWTQAQTLAERLQQPQLIAFQRLQHALALFVRDGEITRTRALVDEAEQLMRDRCVGMSWEVATALLIGNGVRFYHGDLADMRERTERSFHAAIARGDLLAAANAVTAGANTSYLVSDEPGLARSRVDDVVSRWPRDRFILVHFYELLAQANVDLYVGDALAASARVARAQKALGRSFLLQVPIIHFMAFDLRARVELAVASQSCGELRDQSLRRAIAAIRKVRKSPFGWALAASDVLAASAAAVRGERTTAMQLFDTAAAALEARDVRLLAWAARRRHAVLLGGEEGARAAADVDARLLAEGVQKPARFLGIFAP